MLHSNFIKYLLYIEPYGWGMYIPLKADVFPIKTRRCKKDYDKITSKLPFTLAIDDSVICAGVPRSRQSKLLDENNDACQVCPLLGIDIIYKLLVT